MDHFRGLVCRVKLTTLPKYHLNPEAACEKKEFPIYIYIYIGKREERREKKKRGERREKSGVQYPGVGLIEHKYHQNGTLRDRRCEKL